MYAVRSSRSRTRCNTVLCNVCFVRLVSEFGSWAHFPIWTKSVQIAPSTSGGSEMARANQLWETSHKDSSCHKAPSSRADHSWVSSHARPFGTGSLIDTMLCARHRTPTEANAAPLPAICAHRSVSPPRDPRPRSRYTVIFSAIAALQAALLDVPVSLESARKPALQSKSRSSLLVADAALVAT